MRWDPCQHGNGIDCGLVLFHTHCRVLVLGQTISALVVGSVLAAALKAG
jgi:hypothetical protein